MGRKYGKTPVPGMYCITYCMYYHYSNYDVMNSTPGSIPVGSSVYRSQVSPILVNGLSCSGSELSIGECLRDDSICSQGRAGLICQGKYHPQKKEPF